jgi:hypothetical protein
MNTVNRILVILMVLVLLVTCLALSFAPLLVLRGVGRQLIDWAGTLAASPVWLRIAAGLLFALVGLGVSVLMIVLELYRPRSKSVRLEKVGGGEVEVSLQTISDRIKFDVDQLPGVIRARPTVSAQRRGVVVEVAVESAGEVEVPDRARQIVEVVRQAVEERIGVKLAQPPKVRLHAAPVPTSTRAPEPQPEPKPELEPEAEPQVEPQPEEGDE